MSLRNWYAALAVAVGVVGLLLDFWIIAGTTVASATNPVARSLLNMLDNYWTFLTNLCYGAIILAYCCDIRRWRALCWFSLPVNRTGMVGIMMLVMGFYNIMLAPDLHDLPLAFDVSYVLLHDITPLLFLGWWAVFNPHSSLRVRNVPAMLVPGVAYVAYVLLRGLIAGEYPYTILDPTFAIPGHPAQGYLGVAIGGGILVVLVV